MHFADKEYADFFMDLTNRYPCEYTVGALTVSLGSARLLQRPTWNVLQMTVLGHGIMAGNKAC